MIVDNQFDSDYVDIIESSSAERIGGRIRNARLDRGLSQGELGDLVGLNANRVQQYENGARKPKLELLKKFAAALEIETISLMDPVVSSYIGAMYAFFEMEEPFDLRVERDSDGKFFLRFGDGIHGAMNDYLDAWSSEYCYANIWGEFGKTEEEKKELSKEYRIWKRTFPKNITEETEKALERARVKEQIEELQKYYESLGE